MKQANEVASGVGVLTDTFERRLDVVHDPSIIRADSFQPARADNIAPTADTICPLRLAASNINAFCIGDECAWYDGGCAFVRIADALVALVTMAKASETREEEMC